MTEGSDRPHNIMIALGFPDHRICISVSFFPFYDERSARDGVRDLRSGKTSLVNERGETFNFQPGMLLGAEVTTVLEPPLEEATGADLAAALAGPGVPRFYNRYVGDTGVSLFPDQASGLQEPGLS